MSRTPTTHIGTSGWQYLPFRDRFYPAALPHAELLTYYAQHLGAVEINRTFYNFPRASSFEKWAATTPSTFKISIKAHRSFTHETPLQDTQNRLEEFLYRTRLLGPRLGPVLFQFAPSFEADLPKLGAFLKLLPGDIQFAFELRHPSWWQSRTWRLLQKHGVAFCIHDLRKHLSPLELTADFTYIRLHGPQSRAYFGAYSEQSIEAWKDRILSWKKETYVFFDNTIAGDAITDALSLQRSLQNTHGSRASEPRLIAS